ncbi:uncharacterized protein NECHADRAFT_34796, partial [Fusarium vanettenii 77-13-4]
FTAINNSGLPFLDELLPLANWCPTIRNALLALAGLLRVQIRQEMSLCYEDQRLPESTAALERYQVALSTLRERILALQSNNACENDALEVLGSALLLTVAGFPRTMRPEDTHEWSHHMHGMISLVESLDSSITTHSSIGRLVKESVARLDIGAFALGRTQKGHNAWLRWEIHPPETPPSPDFCALEVIMGYPKSLLTIIAAISTILEEPDDDTLSFVIDLVSRLHRQSHPVQHTTTATLHPEPALAINGIPDATLSQIESSLILWKPPKIPGRLASHMAVALTGAWEVMRKAALVYFWRGGFRGNVLAPLPPHRRDVSEHYMREIMFGLYTLLNLYKTHSITMINIMTWPLIVVGNECGGSTQLQNEVESMLRKLQQRFQIEHLKHLSPMLKELWRRFGEHGNAAEDPGHVNSLSLNSLSKELGVCLPLF